MDCKRAMIRVLITLLVSFISMYCSAQGVFTGPKRLNYIGVGAGNEGVYFITEDSQLRFNGCGPNIVIVNKPENALFKESLSIALSAYHAKANVEFYVVGCFDATNIEATAVVVHD